MRNTGQCCKDLHDLLNAHMQTVMRSSKIRHLQNITCRIYVSRNAFHICGGDLSGNIITRHAEDCLGMIDTYIMESKDIDIWLKIVKIRFWKYFHLLVLSDCWNQKCVYNAIWIVQQDHKLPHHIQNSFEFLNAPLMRFQCYPRKIIFIKILNKSW